MRISRFEHTRDGVLTPSLATCGEEFADRSTVGRVRFNLP